MRWQMVAILQTTFSNAFDISILNSIPSDDFWWHRSRSTLVQVMAWCLMVFSGTHLREIVSNWQYVTFGSDNGLVPKRANVCCMLTLNVRGLSYLGLTRSVSWLLMSWLLASPGHQQPWYWLCRMGRSLSYLRKDFHHLCDINVEEYHEM